MIREGTQLGNAQRNGAVKVTDFNKQCTCGDPHDHGTHGHMPASSLQIMENLQDADSSIIRSQIESIMSPRGSDLNHHVSVDVLNAQAVEDASITVKNENLFNMMKESAEREKQSTNANLNKIMGSLQTYKNKQSKRDPTSRVNIPYYRRVMSRNKYAASQSANPAQAIMISK